VEVQMKGGFAGAAHGAEVGKVGDRQMGQTLRGAPSPGTRRSFQNGRRCRSNERFGLAGGGTQRSHNLLEIFREHYWFWHSPIQA
jgi:hypothetical protein